MEVLIRWRCHLCRQPPDARCSYCNGKGYLERWVPYLMLEDFKALFKDTFLIMGRRQIDRPRTTGKAIRRKDK